MFTLAAKADEPGLIEAARIIGVTLTPLPLAALNAQAERILTPSAAAQARFGAPNIAEAAALAGAGEGGGCSGRGSPPTARPARSLFLRWRVRMRKNKWQRL